MNDTTYARLRKIVDQLPESEDIWAVEITGKEIVMMMSPAKRHELIAFRIARQLNAQLERVAPGVIAQSGAEVEDPVVGVMRRPDVIVLPEAALDEEGDGVDPREVLAVVEVVSKSNPENDYAGKMRDYPSMGIPWYLLVDPRKGTGAVLSNITSGPEGRQYATRTDYVFGDTVAMDAYRIDTADFPTY
ncbi:Uma2 family endonuclease [Streptomyces sp. H27-D2]|uniref:Uma2 family endonuclease n=1 Tax=Streptomyces sp. H27-D2 TaxID=3046304 RepID=UPI002DB854AA|nr:Uma2 family endonuclease [Streptomyces sp. H27-D2]MEC4017358.1 Uma2 family endonuclease [Streptomyces sp. H27-D2]